MRFGDHGAYFVMQKLSFQSVCTGSQSLCLQFSYEDAVAGPSGEGAVEGTNSEGAVELHELNSSEGAVAGIS